jgi:AcrR family transcriptional regulator
MSERRTSILDAAQALFLEQGYAATTIAQIRAVCGASTGSIYHAFAGKEAIALALVERAVDGWTRASTVALSGEGIEAQIRATVEGLVTWGLGDPGGFRIMDELSILGERQEAGTALAALLDRNKRNSREVLEEHARRGELRDLPWPLAPALILGPSFEFLRLVRHSPIEVPAEVIARDLSDAAWCAIRVMRNL